MKGNEGGREMERGDVEGMKEELGVRKGGGRRGKERVGEGR